MNGFRLPDHVHRYVTAARAFHTDLVAHAQRRLRLLMNLAEHLNTLRSHNTTAAEKLSAAESSRRHLETLEQLGRSSRDTYSDFRTAVRRLHHHLNRLIAKGRTLTDEPRESAAAIARPVRMDDAAAQQRGASARELGQRRRVRG